MCLSVSFLLEGRKERREGGRGREKEEEMKKGEGKSEGVTAVVGGPQRPHLAGQATVGAIYSQEVIEQIQASQAQTESQILAVRELIKKKNEKKAMDQGICLSPESGDFSKAQSGTFHLPL